MPHTYTFTDLRDVTTLLEKSLSDLLDRDYYLFETENGELCISHRLAIYLENNLSECLSEYNVDCEYFRDGVNRKRLRGSMRTPDIIIHRRGNNFPTNYLCLYAKRTAGIETDLASIEGFLGENYLYKFACFVKYFNPVDNPFIEVVLCYLENNTLIKIPRRVFRN